MERLPAGFRGREGLGHPRRRALQDRHGTWHPRSATRSCEAIAAAEARADWELPESAAKLRERSSRERYRHRRQRLRALAELKDGKTVTAVAKVVGVRPRSIYRWLYRGAAHGLEGALERSSGYPALKSAQAEAMGQWIASDRRHQNRWAIAARAKEAFGIELNPDAASTLLSRHGRAKPGRRRRLWGPKHGPRQKAGSIHDPAPGP
jgi:transposase